MAFGGGGSRHRGVESSLRLGRSPPIDGDDSARVFLRHLERVVYETLFSETPYSHFFAMSRSSSRNV
ncbi:MAG: hypothetical protein R3B96_07745 [Pirellulaceae bacterium]